MIDKRTTTVNEAIQYLTSIGNVLDSVSYRTSKAKRKKFIEAQEFIGAAIDRLRQGLATKDSNDETGE
jgi:hypothetical protein